MALFDQKPEHATAKTWIDHGGPKRLELELRRVYDPLNNVHRWVITLNKSNSLSFEAVFPYSEAVPLLTELGISPTYPVVTAIGGWFEGESKRLQKFMEEKQNG